METFGDMYCFYKHLEIILVLGKNKDFKSLQLRCLVHF